jgi:hypothetical protein
VFVRPTGIPGRELDAQFAMQLQQNAAMAQQARAQEAAAVFGALTQQNAAALQRSRTVNCSSTVVQNVIQTTCN